MGLVLSKNNNSFEIVPDHNALEYDFFERSTPSSPPNETIKEEPHPESEAEEEPHPEADEEHQSDEDNSETDDKQNENESEDDLTLSFDYSTNPSELRSSIELDTKKFLESYNHTHPDLFVLVYNNHLVAYSLSLTELRISANQIRTKLLRDLFSKDPTRVYQTHIYAVDELDDDIIFQLRIFSYPKNNIFQVQKIEESIQIISVSHASNALDNI